MEKHKLTEDTQENSVEMITVGKGETIPLHTHANREEEYECVKGEGIVIVQDIEKSFNKGDKILINKGFPHSVKNIGEEDLNFFAINIPKPEAGDTTFL